MADAADADAHAEKTSGDSPNAHTGNKKPPGRLERQLVSTVGDFNTTTNCNNIIINLFYHSNNNAAANTTDPINADTSRETIVMLRDIFAEMLAQYELGTETQTETKTETM